MLNRHRCVYRHQPGPGACGTAQVRDAGATSEAVECSYLPGNCSAGLSQRGLLNGNYSAGQLQRELLSGNCSAGVLERHGQGLSRLHVCTIQPVELNKV
jgi:hypothetical protein